MQHVYALPGWLLTKNSNGDMYSVYWQFSLKDPWLLPKYDPNFCSGPLYGWLFFYFGREKEKSTNR